jgi:hypothetical protein
MFLQIMDAFDAQSHSHAYSGFVIEIHTSCLQWVCHRNTYIHGAYSWFVIEIHTSGRRRAETAHAHTT